MKKNNLLINFLSRYKYYWCAALFLLVFAALVTLAVPIAFRELIDAGLSDESVDKNFILLFLLAILLGLLVSARFYMMSMIGERVVADLRKEIFSRVIKNPPVFFESLKVGEVLSRLTTDTSLVQTLAGSSISIALRSFILLFGSLIMMMFTSPNLSIIIIALMLFTISPLIFFGKKVRKTSRDNQDRIADISSQAGEVLDSISTVQSFVREGYEGKRFSKAVENAFLSARLRILSRSLLTVLAVTFIFGGVVFVLWLGAKNVSSGRLSFGELTQFVFYAVFMAGSFAALAEVWGDLQRALGASERLSELLGGQGEENNRPLSSDSGVAFKIKNIKFVDVDFAYPVFPEKKVLNQVSFTLDEGSMNAIVGPSGAGKSTVFMVLLGFYKSLKGEITFSDRDISTLPVNFIRESVSVVSQNPSIFSASAMDNIRYGKLEASDDEVILAAKAANAHGFISELQEGYQSFLGQKGVRLSGGQRQRIAIARALLKNSSILLLDEATSSLDSKSEVEVQKGLEKLLPGRTSLVIAHRLATVRRADKIIVMDKGKIVESGKHEFLIKNNGLYSKLAAFQFEI